MKNHYRENFLERFGQYCAKTLPVPEHSRRKPPVFKFGEQSILTDYDNNSFVDFYLGGGRLLTGHAPRQVILAAKKYAERGIVHGSVSASEAQLAGLINEFYNRDSQSVSRSDCPYYDHHTAFFHSELTALLAAVVCARRYTERETVVTFDVCRQTYALQHILGKSLTILPLNKPDGLEQINHSTAAVVIQPVATGKFITPLTPDFTAALVRKLNETKAVFIRDLITPVVHADSLTRSDIFTGVPAVDCLGGFFNAGFGFGMLTGSKELLDALPPHSQGNVSPVTLKAAFALLRSLNKNTIVKLLGKADELQHRLTTLLSGQTGGPRLHHAAQMFALQFSENDIEHKQIYARFWEYMIAKGFYFPPGAFEPFFISTKHSRKELDGFTEHMTAFLKGGSL